MEGRKGRKEGGCLATGILHQTKKKGRKNLLQQRQLLRKGEIPVKLRKLIPTAITPRGSEPPHTRDPLSPAGGNQPPAGTSGYFKPVPFSNPFLFPLNYDATQGRERHTAPRPTTSPFPRPLPSGPRRPRAPSPALGSAGSPAALPAPPAAPAPLPTPVPPDNGRLASARPAAPHHSPPPPAFPPPLRAIPAYESLRPGLRAAARYPSASPGPFFLGGRSGMAAQLEKGRGRGSRCGTRAHGSGGARAQRPRRERRERARALRGRCSSVPPPPSKKVL